MTRANQADLQQQRIAYLGAVAASLSHEINNVLATVGELSGLIGDLADGAAPDARAALERFSSIGEKIERHVDRGKGYVASLNRFAHSMDRPRTAFDAGESVAAVVAVCERFARLRKLTLRLERGAAGPELRGSPYDFEHLVFRAIAAGLAAVEGGGEVTVVLSPAHTGAVLEITADGQPVADAEQETRLALVERLGLELGADVGLGAEPPAVLRVRLALPEDLGSPEAERSS